MMPEPTLVHRRAEQPPKALISLKFVLRPRDQLISPSSTEYSILTKVGVIVIFYV